MTPSALTRRARMRLVYGIALGVLGSTACAQLLELSELPLATPAVDAGDAEPQDVTEPGDASDACAPRGNDFCQLACPPYDFCEDFERGTSIGSGWRSFDGGDGATPIIVGDASMKIVVDDDAGGTHALFTNLVDHAPTSTSALLTGLLDEAARKKAKPRGATIAFQLKVDGFALDFDAGASSGTKSLSLFDFAHVPDQASIGIALTQPSAGAQISLQLVERAHGAPVSSLFEIVGGSLSDFLVANIDVEITLATEDLMRELKAFCTTTAAPDEIRIIVKAGQSARKCSALHGSLTDPGWLQTAAITAGLEVGAFGRGAAHIDDIAVRFLE